MREKRVKRTLIFLAALLCVVLLFGFVFLPFYRVRKAITLDEVKSPDYIVAYRHVTVGADWTISEYGDVDYGVTHCFIEGPNPYDEYSLNYEFEQGNNFFIFYVSGFESTEISSDTIYTFTVSGWDILYPVKRYNFDLFASDWYMTRGDTLWS